MKLACLILLLFPQLVIAQREPVYQIPGSTGYAQPEDTRNPGVSFNEAEGVAEWLNRGQPIHYFFRAGEPGKVKLGIEFRKGAPGAAFRWSCNKQGGTINFTSSGKQVTVNAGHLNFTHPGFYELILSPISEKTRQLPVIVNISFTGKAAAAIHANRKPRRNAASVHLGFPVDDSVRATGFYSELKVPRGYDPLYSYYMACGFSRGYFGMQVNSPSERRIIFSVWDSGVEPADRGKVNDSDRVQLTSRGEGVAAESFGNEGTGGHSHWVYDWKADSTYRFYVTALPDSAETYYTGYFFLPETGQWKLLAAFKAPHDGKYLKKLYSFVENFDGSNGQLERKALFGNQWIQTESRQWKELNQAVFTCDQTGMAGDRVDFATGIEAGSFYLSNGGFREGNTRAGYRYARAATGQAPAPDLYINADSLATADREKAAIASFISSTGNDSTSYVNGIYYKILREGTGRHVLLSDTVVAFYKGSILNGEVFDQTAREPATFPLNRLIRGWQIGVPLCRVGGKIRLILPSALAYSIRTRSAKIPPNSILVFDIEVMEVR